jgi:hypothetical protein
LGGKMQCDAGTRMKTAEGGRRCLFTSGKRRRHLRDYLILEGTVKRMIMKEYLERRNEDMSLPDMLGRVYGIVLRRLVATGQAPHYTEIAAEAGMPVEEGRKALHDLIDAAIPAMWLYPETDLICSIAPFSNLPTQYRISVDGVQKWFGQ